MSKKNEQDLEQFTVTGRLLARTLGVSERRVRQLADEGIIVRVKKRKLWVSKIN